MGEDITVILIITDTGVERDLLMPSLRLMPKLNHGGVIADTTEDITDIHMVMQDTITLENDLLMLNPNQKPSHGTDTVMDMDILIMDMDIVDTDTGVKPSFHYYQSYLRNAL